MGSHERPGFIHVEFIGPPSPDQYRLTRQVVAGRDRSRPAIPSHQLQEA